MGTVKKRIQRSMLIFGLVGLAACKNPVIEQGSTTTSTESDTSNTSMADGNQNVVIAPDPTINNNTGNSTLTEPVQKVPVDEGFLINDGAPRTRDSNLFLRFVTETPKLKVKINFGTDCSAGTWYPFSDMKELTTTKKNQRVDISVQFSDLDYYLSPCYTNAIIQDEQGPGILFSKYPVSPQEEGNFGEVIYEVKDTLSDIDTVICKLNGVVKPCAAGRNTVSLGAMPLGAYSFEIWAVDELGNESLAKTEWLVSSTTRALSQNVKVNDYKKVDILIVIDNSGSMEYEQKNMASRVSNLLSVIRGLDWQIAVTTTDPRTVTLGDGNFIQLYGKPGQYILNSTMNESESQQTLGMTLQRPEIGSGSEQPIFTTYRVIEKSLSTSFPVHQKFFRTGAQFATVVISDEDESANGTKNDPQNLLKLISTTFGDQKAFSFHTIITKPGDSACKDTHGATYGERLKTLSDLTGGVVGSVCASDYASQVTGIAEGVRAMLKTMTLQCAPLTDRGFTITVTRNGAAVSEAFKVEGFNIVFNNELESGDYNVQYRCLK